MSKIETSVKNQYFAALSVNMITLNYGAFNGWTSASLLVLQSEESPLETGPMTDSDAGWVSAMAYLGGILSVFIFAWFAEKWGRRMSLISVTVPAVLGWLIVPFARNPLELCVSRLLGGSTAGAIFGVIPIYVTEIADTNIRGVLGSFLMFSYTIGLLLAFILGYFFSYATVAWILLGPCLIYLSSFLFLPETPQYLLSRKRFEQAEKSYCFFRNIRMGAVKLPESYISELKNHTTTEKNSLSWQDFFNPKACKAIFIGLFLSTLYIFCGLPSMLNYAASIFQKTNSSLSPNMSAIVVGVVQVLGSCISTILVEKSGRKPLLIASSIGTAFGLCCLGVYSHFDVLGYDVTSFSWMPVTSFSIALLFTCIGIFPVTYILISELTPPKLRSLGSMICMLWMRVLAFAMLILLPFMMRYMGMHYMVYMFGICSLIGVAFILIFIPETKGKTIEAIQASL